MKAVKAVLCASLAIAGGLHAAPANATGFTDVGQDLRAHPDTAVVVGGSLRLRSELLYNLDLDRGTTPSGQPLFPIPLSDPGSQTLTHADLRFRTDLAFYAPGGGVAIKLRVDALDNLSLGSLPDGVPSSSAGQRSPDTAVRIKRAYGEALTPVGVLSAGRTGSQWGLGMVANGGDCADCDGGDAADRIAFLTPLAGHIWAAAYDFSASGPLQARPGGARAIDLDPADDVRSVTFAVLRWRDDLALDRRRRAGKVTMDYGAYLSHRWQDRDVPGWYLPAGRPSEAPVAPGPGATMARGFRATAVDGWARLTLPGGRIEAEVAGVLGAIDQPSLYPGVLLPRPIRSTQLGGALETEWGAPEDAFGIGLDLGFATGDPAPGFGAFPGTDGRAPQPGDLDGAQAIAPHDYRVDNFRFHPDYRVDRILFRELLGTVTDAFYARPHARYRVDGFGAGALTVGLFAVFSTALEARSTPSGQAPLGIEIDPTVVYESRDGFAVALEHALLLPLAGLDNPTAQLGARPAQLVRLRLVYGF